jgi:hypothetical protein
VASAAAAYVIIVVGFVAGVTFCTLLASSRAWRFVGITLAGLLSFFDEIALRVRPTWNAVGIDILSRYLIGATF